MVSWARPGDCFWFAVGGAGEGGGWEGEGGVEDCANAA